MDRLKEQTVSSERLFSGKLLHVYRDEVRLPNGKTSEREWIDHPGAAATIALFENGDTILVRQFRYPSRRIFLELPAGKFDEEGEEPQTVASRELEEETGWKAAHWHYLGKSHPCIGYSNEVIHYFLAEHLSKGEANLQEAEFLEAVRLPLREVLDMAASGRIHDMKTVAGLHLAQSHLARIGREIVTK